MEWLVDCSRKHRIATIEAGNHRHRISQEIEKSGVYYKTKYFSNPFTQPIGARRDSQDVQLNTIHTAARHDHEDRKAKNKIGKRFVVVY